MTQHYRDIGTGDGCATCAGSGITRNVAGLLGPGKPSPLPDGEDAVPPVASRNATGTLCESVREEGRRVAVRVRP
jgi:hypothetical protein